MIADNDASDTHNNYQRGINGADTQVRWAVVNNKWHAGAFAPDASAAVWEIDSGYWESILWAGNQFVGSSFLDTSGSTFIRNYMIGNTCTNSVSHPSGTTFRGNIGC